MEAKFIQPAIVYVRRKPKKSSINIPDFKSMSEEEKIKLRESYTLEINTYKNKWPNLGIVEVSDKDTLENIYIRLHTIKQNVEIQTKFNQFRNYFVVGLFLMHSFVTVILKINCDGLIESQLKVAHIYEHYLYEMSKKFTESEEGNSISPEVMLVILLGINVALYVIFKRLSNSLGGLGGLINKAEDMINKPEQPKQETKQVDNLLNNMSKLVTSVASSTSNGGLLNIVGSLLGNVDSNTQTK